MNKKETEDLRALAKAIARQPITKRTELIEQLLAKVLKHEGKLEIGYIA